MKLRVKITYDFDIDANAPMSKDNPTWVDIKKALSVSPHHHLVCVDSQGHRTESTLVSNTGVMFGYVPMIDKWEKE